MKVLISGSRSIENFDISKFIPKETELIICGGAKGIDHIAEKFSDDRKISKLILRPRYDLFGRSAPLRRNETMVELADMVIVIWDGKSKGSKYTIDYTKKKNKALKIIVVEKK